MERGIKGVRKAEQKTDEGWADHLFYGYFTPNILCHYCQGETVVLGTATWKGWPTANALGLAGPLQP